MRYRWDPAYPAATRHRVPDGGSGLRASDAERNEVSEQLSRHFADGRLDQGEFKARLDRAMGAVTRGDLEGLFDDLPRLDGDPVPTRPRRRLFLPALLLVVLVTAAGWATVSAVHIPWLLFLVIGLFLWHRGGRRRDGSRDEPRLHR